MEMIRKQLEARHPRAMQARAEKSMHHRAARAIRQWLIVFILLTAGAGTAAAAQDEWNDRGTVDVNGVRYHLYYFDYRNWQSNDRYVAYVEAFVGSPTEVTILNEVTNGYSTYEVQGMRLRITGGSAYGYDGERTATITSNSVRRINFEGYLSFNGEAGNPTFNCPNLQEVYFLGGTPSFSGNWSDIFGSPATGKVTAYVKGKTQEQCVALKTNNAVWSGFKDVKPYQETYSCTMGSSGLGEVYVVDLGDYSSFASNVGVLNLPKPLFIASGLTGPKTANLSMGKNYSVVYVASVATKIPTLKRNGTEVPLTYVTYGNNKYAFYNETNLQENVNYQWSHTFNTVSVTLANETNGTVFISDLGSYSSFENNGAQNRPHLIDLNGKGSRTTARVKDGNYATVYVNSDPTKIPKLKIRQNSGNIIFPDQTPTTITHDGVEYAYYNLPTPTYIHFSYTWTTIDKQCSVSFTQKQLPNNTAKTGTVNVKNGSTQQSFNTATKTYSFSQGSTMELDIPFDPAVQTLSSINVGGTNILPQAENGHYKATVTVPQSNSLAVELIWNEPIPEPPVQAHQLPKVMVMRTGEGSVGLYGRVALTGNNWTQRVFVNCTDPVTTVTISDLGNNDELLDADRWGMHIPIWPAKGQELKSLMIGVIDTEGAQPTMRWTNILDNPDYADYLTFHWQYGGGGYYIFDTTRGSGFPPADYTIMVEMGEDAEFAANNKILNFVNIGRDINGAVVYSGGNEYELQFENGISRYTSPNEDFTYPQLQIYLNENETLRVYKDGVDITSDFVDHNIYYEANLEQTSATYAILVETKIEEENVEAVQTIPFIDEVVKQICVENWDTDGDGELSFVEAQNVTSLGEVFMNSAIETFDELKHFTGLTELWLNFYGCQNLKKITLPPTLSRIDTGSFFECTSLESIELPNTLDRIDDAIFYGSGLKEIFIPANVLIIGEDAFDGVGLELILIDRENPVYESGIYHNAIIERETQTAIILCDNTPIPEGVRRLGDRVWVGMEKITQLVVPVSVEEIGMDVFSKDLEMLTMKRREPVAYHEKYFGFESPTNCQLIVPFGTRDAYIAAGWTEDIFKGGVVEDDSILDVNGDGVIDGKDVKAIKNNYLNQN